MTDPTNLQRPAGNRRFLIVHLLWVVAWGVLMISTWRLWVGTPKFPQIPLLSVFVGTPIWIDYVALVVCGISSVMIVGTLVGKRSNGGETLIAPQLKLACLIWVLGLAVLFSTNQHRLQPWAWQFFIFAILIVLSPTKQCSIIASRVVVVSIYLWSAIGKFDFQFLNGLGKQFPAEIANLIGYPIPSETISTWVVGLLPLGELLVAVLLIFQTTRRLGVLTAIGLHLGLVAILGPWGMDHHVGVVIWNLVFALISAILFWPTRKQPDSQAESFSPERFSTKHTLTIVFTAIVVCLPLYSAWDHWLAWGLYSPNNRRCTLQLIVPPGQDIDETLQPFLVPVESEFVGADVLEFDMGRMSLELLDAPIYPEARMQLGVVRWVQQRFNPPASIVSIQGKSDRFTGVRKIKKVEITQPPHQRAQFFFNHLPR